MRRWNGWGDPSVSVPLPASASAFLEARLGAPTPPRDATLADVVAAVPTSRLTSHPLVTTDAEERVRHARGQSLPDWIALRSGRLGVVPDGVAFPENAEDVRELLGLARAGVRLIPFGGGTSVAGHVNPLAGEAPVLTVDLRRMSRLLSFDDESRLATFGAGVFGPDLEAQLRARGFTLGHFPQSFELSTLGGWVATRSSGQQSLGYGRIERLFAGGRLEAPAGSLVLPPFPASAAGPDLRELVLGSEGRLGIVTEATVRVTPVPDCEDVTPFLFPDWERGLAATRAIAQARLALSMIRLSGAEETRSTFALAGAGAKMRALEAWLKLRGAGDGKCLLLVLAGGTLRDASRAIEETLDVARPFGAVAGPRAIGRRWLRDRFRGPYLRNTLWDMGYAIDTLETAATWDRVPALVADVERSIRGALEGSGERVHVFTHLSHCYPSGSSAYTTYLFRAAAPDETLRRWAAMKGAASEAIVRCGGTISHQHGVGLDHAPYLEAEKGALGMSALATICRAFDPDGAMNPGKLLA